MQARQEKTFLLGVGAQKAGTSWLYRYLADHPECAMGTIKEYSVFDFVFVADRFKPRIQAHLKSLAGSINDLAAKLAAGNPLEPEPKLLEVLDILSFSLDLGRYVDHFDGLLRKSPQAHLTGDITPEYCALDGEHYARIRDLLSDAGYRIRVVFLMRDPVERCYSMLRMDERNQRNHGKTVERPAHVRLETDALQPWCEIRTRYDRTILALEHAFRPEELFYGFYEDFMNPDAMRELTNFLGIGFAEPNLDRRENWSPRDTEPSAGAIAAVRNHYAPVYDFCAARFGEARVKRLWPHA